MKRILVCGGRDFDDWHMLDQELSTWGEFQLVEGGATGADFLAKVWVKWKQLPTPLTFKADWEAHGKAAGGIRNQKMLDAGKPDFVIAFPGGRGTADMVRRAEAAGVKVVKYL